MMKKTVAIIAPTGMLGSMVYAMFKDQYKLVLVYRDEKKLLQLENLYGEARGHKKVQCNIDSLYKDYFDINLHKKFPSKSAEILFDAVGEVDSVINCAGIIIPHALHSPERTYFINAAFPHILSAQYGKKLIHVTTDCVFDGVKNAPYDENSPRTPKDLYGITKLLGEPGSQSLVLRTSIIGPEIDSNTSLFEWLRSQKGKTVNGYTNHHWNGLTTKHFAKVLATIINNRAEFPDTGLYHIFSSDISKYELLKLINERYNLNVEIIPKSTESVDRRLRTKYTINKQLAIPSIDKMIADL